VAHLESAAALESFAVIQEEPVPSPSSSLLRTTARLGIAVQLLPLVSQLPAQIMGGEREGGGGGGGGGGEITRVWRRSPLWPTEPNRIEIL
jgi:hypothetical protein